ETAQFSNRATAGRVERGPYSGHSPDRNAQIRRAAKPRERAVASLCLACGTSLERIAPESLTQCLSEFVHGPIWGHRPGAPQNRVSGRKRGVRSMPDWITG